MPNPYRDAKGRYCQKNEAANDNMYIGLATSNYYDKPMTGEHFMELTKSGNVSIKTAQNIEYIPQQSNL